MKVCKKCNLELDLSSFAKEKNSRDGLRGECKNCRKAYRESRKEESKLYHQNYYKQNKEAYNKRSSKYRRNNREKCNKQSQISLKKNRHRANLNKIKYYHKRKNDPIYNLVYKVRNRTKNAILTKGFRKDFDYPEYIGCSKEDLKKHIESQFTDGMCWDKVISGEIHIDHILPIGKAKSEEEVFKLAHYTNLQPLWAKDNLKKGTK